MNNDHPDFVEVGEAADLIQGKGGVAGDDITEDLGAEVLED